MKKRRKVKITTVRRRSIKVELNAPIVRCPVCRREVETLTKAEAADVLEINDYSLARLIAEGQVHAMRTLSGSLRICKDSLFEPTGDSEIVGRKS